MLKKIIVILLILALAGGGGYFYLNKDKEEGEGKEKELNVGKNWNPYATEDSYLVTLDDKTVTIAKGENIGKITVTLQFKDAKAHDKFQGLSKPLTDKEREKAGEDGGHGDDDHAVSPMNVKINSLISEFMMNIGTEEAKSVEYIQENLKNYLNEKLGLENDFIKQVLIEQYVLQ